MTTPTINTADPIGLIEAREKFPHITGSGVSLHQVEHIRNGAWCPGDRITTSYSTIPIASVGGAISGHAVGVLGRAVSIAPGIGPISAQEAAAYRGRNSLWDGFTFEPAPALATVECHAYGANLATVGQRPCERLDYRIARDGCTVVAALDNGKTVYPIWAHAQNVLLVGNRKGNHPTGYVQLVGNDDTSSYSCGQVAGVAALVRGALAQRWSHNGIGGDLFARAALLATATPMGAGYGAGMVHAARALEWVAGLDNGRVELAGSDMGHVITLHRPSRVTFALVWLSQPKPNANFTQWERPNPGYYIPAPSLGAHDIRALGGTFIVVDQMLPAGATEIGVRCHDESPRAPWALAWWVHEDQTQLVKPIEVAPPEPEPIPELPVDRYAIIRREAEVITQEKGGGYLYDDEECERLIAAVDRQREAWAQEDNANGSQE